MKKAKSNYTRKNQQWRKHHPWLKRRIFSAFRPTLFQTMLADVAKNSPALRHFLTFDVKSLKDFDPAVTPTPREWLDVTRKP
jgi:hypothetical protein